MRLGEGWTLGLGLSFGPELDARAVASEVPWTCSRARVCPMSSRLLSTLDCIRAEQREETCARPPPLTCTPCVSRVASHISRLASTTTFRVPTESHIPSLQTPIAYHSHVALLSHICTSASPHNIHAQSAAILHTSRGPPYISCSLQAADSTYT